MDKLLLLFLKNYKKVFKGHLKKIKLINLQKKINCIQDRIVKKTKVGVSYNVFDGVELLERSIMSIRSRVDYINVVFQKESNFGEKCDENAISVLNDLLNKKVIDNLIIYTPNRSFDARKNELKKRNIGLIDCRKHGCKYFLIMDCDEFYFEEEFDKAKKFVLLNGISNSYCSIYCYILKPIYRCYSVCKNLYVPFLQKITRFSKIKNKTSKICTSDATRSINNHFQKRRYYMLDSNLIAMHHMSHVRKNLEIKYRNSTANINPVLLSYNMEMLSRVLSYKYPNKFVYPNGNEEIIIQVDDYFSLADVIK